ncbi:Hypothetical protein LUCI_0835 [Lucifera butyrica]|uniref:Uncharacterized protein n=1 Tax=Lucifera butyrica TaxID=1351585 RepID=A0A498R399_9FIRM|nr:Hypothetical protein LUCI_0835 [Lucifera butyrica]
MKINKIKYPVPLSDIKDIENDNIDVFVELEDGITYTVVVSTPKNLMWYMDKEEMNYINPSPPFIIVRTLTEDNIKNALESFAEKDAYWLKLYHLVGKRDDVFNIKEMDKVIKDMHEEMLKDYVEFIGKS